MYPYMHPAVGSISMCCYCAASNRFPICPKVSGEPKSMMRGNEESEEERKANMPPTQPMGQQMQDMTDMSKMNMGKIQSDTQEIVRMLEQHHSDMVKILTDCGMPIGQARQYLSSVVEMTLMHHMMHQM